MAIIMGGCGAEKQTDSDKMQQEETVESVEATAEPIATSVPEETSEATKETWTYTPPEKKKPLELSGNPEDEYVLTEPEYIETDEFIMFMDKGTKLYGNTPELIATIFDLVEKETGLSRDNVPDFAYIQNQGPKDVFYGCSEFLEIDPECEKFHVYVCDRGAPNGGYGYIYINRRDLEIAAGEGNVIIHEFTHSLQAANGPWMSQFMDEGYSTYITAMIAERDEIIPFNYDSYYNFSGYDEINRDNAEKNLRENEEYCQENYEYGFRLMHFLMETYGEDIFRTILADACTMVDKNWNEIYMEETIECLKRNTSENVFEEFGDWMQKNRDRFEVE